MGKRETDRAYHERRKQTHRWCCICSRWYPKTNMPHARCEGCRAVIEQIHRAHALQHHHRDAAPDTPAHEERIRLYRERAAAGLPLFEPHRVPAQAVAGAVGWGLLVGLLG